MSFTLVLNSKNSYDSGNNTYKYDFIQGNFTIGCGDYGCQCSNPL